MQPLDGHAAPLAVLKGGRKVRVPGAVPGDDLEIEITARGRQHLWGRVHRLLRPSSRRVEAPCPLVDRCGACPWQAVRYREQLTAKGRTLRAAIRRFSDAPVHDPQGIAPPLGYRTKIQMPVRGAPGALELGFYAPRTHDFVSAPSCVVQHPAGEAVRTRLLAALNGHPEIAPYDEVTGEGDLRYVLIRVAEGTGDVGVVLVVRSYEETPVDWAVLAAELTSIEGITGVFANENPTRGNAVLGGRTVHLGGARRLRDQVSGVELHRAPTAFFQTNHRAAERLVSLVGELLPLELNHLVDVYAGGGLFSAVLGSRAQALTLIESNAQAVAAARATLSSAGLSADIHLKDAAEGLNALVADGLAVDAVIADPPRAGLSGAALEALATLSPAWLVYVSCRPGGSFTRDLAALVERGYRLREVRSVDMFPHTPHLEAVGLLVR